MIITKNQEPLPWERPIGDPQRQDRDIVANPYDRQERRVVDYLWSRELGGGGDPVGYLIASRAWSSGEREAFQKIVRTARAVVLKEPGLFPDLEDAIEELDAWQCALG